MSADTRLELTTEPAGLWAVVAVTKADYPYTIHLVRVPMPIVDDELLPLWQIVGSEDGWGVGAGPAHGDCRAGSRRNPRHAGARR